MRLVVAVALVVVMDGVARAQNCAGVSTGAIPLTELASGDYLGFAGGLYPGTSFARPEAHDTAGLIEAAEVVPRDALGVEDPAGRVVLLSIGMSNASLEFAAFQDLAAAHGGLAPELTIVDGAIPGWTLEPISDPAAPYWDLVEDRLADAGVTAAQVQALWFKEGNAAPGEGFPAHAHVLRDQAKTVAGILRSRYPYARLMYVSSRIYAGYATIALNPEPVAYESGFAWRWLIEDQIAGDPSLVYDPSLGTVVAPWIAWGPYLWADGLRPRADGLVWECDDFHPDGTHPDVGAQAKVAQALLDFFTHDATARGWFLADPLPVCGPVAGVEGFGAAFGGIALHASAAPAVPSPAPLSLTATGAPPSAPGLFAVGFARLPAGAVPLGEGSLQVLPLVWIAAVADAAGRASVPVLELGAEAQLALCGATVHAQFGAPDPSVEGGIATSAGLTLRVGH